ncbi:MAG: DNA translocase FtsK 4TM domain-containing protein [Ruminococcus sp.]|jgi:S-DNA-T family DNA segregation ATPase FtsK/SpoIIIE
MAGARKRKTQKQKTKRKGNALYQDIIILLTLAVSILLFISNFGVGGFVGNAVSSFFFGLFGLMAYIFPALLFVGTAFYISNKDNRLIRRKMTGAVGCLFFMCGFLHLLTMGTAEGSQVMESFMICAKNKMGGGILGAFQSWLFSLAFGKIGAYVIIVAGLIIFVIILTQKPVISSLRRCGEKAYENAAQTHKRRKEVQKERSVRKREEKRSAPVDVVLKKEDSSKEFKIPDFLEDFPSDPQPAEAAERPADIFEEPPRGARKKNPRSSQKEIHEGINEIRSDIREQESPEKHGDDYELPPLSLLKKSGKNKESGRNSQVKATAMKLQQTLKNFGVNVTVTDVSCGPTVTRYELQPEQGVKVSRIVNLADDIKLNLAASDIRIEAPIPGKAAVGIEVPNQTNSAVLLRDLLESDAFQEYPSNLAFAVGKDIAGQPVVADIAKMPHLLIAGATGSGKSVCINTLIMSILYKAKPEDVKLIMIDPKVVELSVYNGIPHLYIPVVTDPKKAAGALNWAVAEMTDRYNKFAEYNVRDLKGYNAKVAGIQGIEEENKPKKLPQIVIIVDELADLMMVAPGEVEDAICRLAQLARAAGIHLIIATQRPSVNVITGLIKANMPSRIAFSVSSGVDSRTIIDMNGAEKLLGKGDMLFYPQGYQKPARVQGSFVSDKEVSSVVEFLAQNHGVSEYDTQIEEQINHHSSIGGSINEENSEERDVYFEKAGRFIIEKDKASIGMLQRMFKIGFNRAARIMDQLSEAGVVGPEEGTKPRKVLMSMEEFEKYIEEVL